MRRLPTLIQRDLEHLYRLPRGPDVADFLIGPTALAHLGEDRDGARERLLVLQGTDGLEIALFIDDDVLHNLGRRPPSHVLDERNLNDFCLLAEGVSHFVYLVWKAHRGVPVTQLEMELQAEVDKYVACLLVLLRQGNGLFPTKLRDRLFHRISWREDLEETEVDRYRTANRLASSYCAYLEAASIRGGHVGVLFPELRAFYRLTHHGKLDHIVGTGN